VAEVVLQKVPLSIRRAGKPGSGAPRGSDRFIFMIDAANRHMKASQLDLL
jgi:hypothetical protein